MEAGGQAPCPLWASVSPGVTCLVAFCEFPFGRDRLVTRSRHFKYKLHWGPSFLCCWPPLCPQTQVQFSPGCRLHPSSAALSLLWFWGAQPPCRPSPRLLRRTKAHSHRVPLLPLGSALWTARGGEEGRRGRGCVGGPLCPDLWQPQGPTQALGLGHGCPRLKGTFSDGPPLPQGTPSAETE